MFKNMKLAAKIGVGFGALVIIAIILGGLAVWSMNGVSRIAFTMKDKNVPAVAVANNVERNSLSTMYAARGYVYSEESQFLDQTRTELAGVMTELKNAQELADKESIDWLKKNAAEAVAGATEYGRLFEETVKATAAMAKEEVNILYLEMKREDAFAVGQLTLEVKSLPHLTRVFKRMKAIKEVIHVERVDEVGVVFAFEIPLERAPGSVDLGAAGVDQGVGCAHREILVPVILNAGRIGEGRAQRKNGGALAAAGGRRGVVAEPSHQEPGVGHSVINPDPGMIGVLVVQVGGDRAAVGHCNLGLAEFAPVLPVDRPDQRQFVGEGLIGPQCQLRRDGHVDFQLGIQQPGEPQGVPQ
ncbi:MAG: hypothetical protein HGA82_00865 [Anaerolineales bacterium]|nr:hypothetical protein [Anaerolineales bacterium]